MRTFRNLTYVLLILTTFSFAMIIPFSMAKFDNATTITIVGVFVAVFAVSLVAFIASLMMYFQSKNTAVTTLKRRGGRIYSELLHHKTLLISAIDGDKHVSEWDHYLYDPDEFPRMKKLLGEDYFLLLSCDSFFCNSEAAKVYNDFKTFHNELSAFVRSVSYDRIECAKFKKYYAIKTGHEMTSRTPEEEFLKEPFLEPYEALRAANEQALQTTESLLGKIEKYELRMDQHYSAGVDWKTSKKILDARYQVWLHATEV